MGLVLSLVIGVAVAPRLLAEPDAPSGAALEVGRTGTPNTADWKAALADTFRYDRCQPSAPEACTLAEGDGPTVLVAGESHAAMWLPMLEDLAERNDWTLRGGLLDFCPWTRGVRYRDLASGCFRDQDRLYDEIVEAVDPDIVILGHRPVDDPANRLEIEAAPGIDPTASMDEAVRRSIEALRAERLHRRAARAHARRRTASDHAHCCLSNADYLEPCRFVASDGPLPEEAVFRDLDTEYDDVVSIDLDQAVCPFLPICDPVVGGEVVKWDATHITMTYARTFGDEFEKLLRERGVIDDP